MTKMNFFFLLIIYKLHKIEICNKNIYSPRSKTINFGLGTLLFSWSMSKSSQVYKVIYEFSFLSKNFQVPHFISIPLPSSVGNGCLLIKVLILEILIPLHNNLIFAERFFHECPMTTMQKMLSITSSASPLEWLRVWDGAKMNLSLRNR